jgi:translation initiation factor IF-3
MEAITKMRDRSIASSAIVRRVQQLVTDTLIAAIQPIERDRLVEERSMLMLLQPR